MKECGRGRLTTRTDGDPAVKAFARLVQSSRLLEDPSCESILDNTSKGESQAIGQIERGNRTVGAWIRVLKDSSERRLALRMELDHPVTAWLVRHAGWIVNRFLVGQGGRTGYERC